MSFIFRIIFILLDFGVSLYLVFNSVKAMHQVKVQASNMQDFLNAKKGFYNCAKISVVIKLLYWFIIPKVDNVMQVLIAASLISYALVFIAAIIYTLPLHIFSKKFQKTKSGLYFHFIKPPIVMAIAMFVLAWFTVAPIVPVN
ncbi:MAG: hypothetical protein IKA17_10145 [Clostridia bacterium]|nr:hypothetical protein [Clostridia bacterium]